MEELKIGDRVITKTNDNYNGKNGVITRVGEGGVSDYMVLLDKRGEAYFKRSELIKIPKTSQDKTEISLQSKEDDKVNSPNHYTSGGIESIDYMQAKLSEEAFQGFLHGNILKYISRANYKNGMEDLKKAQWYLNKLIEVKGSATK